jgi:sugar phosphate isomerase/epimerase
MIKSGICSVTLAKKSVSEVIAIVKKAGLEGIEWWGKDHVPHGDIATAVKVKTLTEEAGLKVSSYGSYYQSGVSEAEDLSFQSVLDTAVALGAPTIRIWAGNCDYGKADETLVEKVVSDTMRIADMAAKAGLTITFEFHGGTLTDNNDNAIKFASLVEHPAIFFSWQAPHGYTTEHCLEGLNGLLPRLSTIHVYHWTIGSYEKNTVSETIRPLKYPEDFHRHPLSDVADRWREYFKAVNSTGRDHFALLEFVKDDSPEQVIEDGKTLRKLLCR